MYVRQIEDKILTFIVSGRLWRNNLIMLDLNTETYWNNVTGDTLIGPLKDTELTTIPSVQTTWVEWVIDHPDTRVLKKNKDIKASVYEDYFHDDERIGLIGPDGEITGLPPKDIVHGFTVESYPVAVADDTLTSGIVVNDTIAGEPVIVLRASSGGVRAYMANAGEYNLTFRKASKEKTYIDHETGSIWDLEKGICTSGPLKGEKLKELTVTVAYWFAWSTFYPQTRLIE